jgi:ABC-type branched-subunit amino acid transport system ATPase component
VAAIVSALDVSRVGVRYGGVAALEDVSLVLESGLVTGFIGPNGAGKTSLINAISGIAPIASGLIALDGKRIDGLPPHRIARAGVARTYQNLRIFRALTVAQNVRAGAFAAKAALGETEVAALLDRAGVLDVTPGVSAASLPYGLQRRLEIARALAGAPRVLLLDEPAAGLNPEETERLGAVIRDIAASGTAVMLVEHDMQLVSEVCDRVVVVNFGHVIAEGTPAQIAADSKVVEAYLGHA